MSKRRKGFPSETQVRRGRRIVHGEKELAEKLGRNDLCPCGSGRRFQELLPEDGPLSTERCDKTTSVEAIASHDRRRIDMRQAARSARRRL